MHFHAFLFAAKPINGWTENEGEISDAIRDQLVGTGVGNRGAVNLFR